MTCYEFAVEQIHNLLREEKDIRFNFTLNSVKKILSLIERLQGIKKNCVEMSNAKYNIKNELIFKKAFSSTQYFPPIQKKNKNTNDKNNNIKNLDDNENKLKIKDDINFHENIYNILNKTIPNRTKSNERNESNEILIQDERNNSSEIRKNSDENNKKEKEKEECDENSLKQYKKVKIFNSKDSSKNIFTTYKTPIRDFIIKNDLNYQTILFPRYKKNKMKNVKYFTSHKQKKKNNSYFKESSKELQNNESTEGKGENMPTKSKMETGIKVNNLFY